MKDTDPRLLPCPFCGLPPYWERWDRGQSIGCAVCGYHRSFPGLIQTKPSNSPVRAYRRHDGTDEVRDLDEVTEWYHADAHIWAIEGWNKRT